MLSIIISTEKETKPNDIISTLQYIYDYKTTIIASQNNNEKIESKIFKNNISILKSENTDINSIIKLSKEKYIWIIYGTPNFQNIDLTTIEKEIKNKDHFIMNFSIQSQEKYTPLLNQISKLPKYHYPNEYGMIFPKKLFNYLNGFNNNLKDPISDFVKRARDINTKIFYSEQKTPNQFSIDEIKSELKAKINTNITKINNNITSIPQKIKKIKKIELKNIDFKLDYKNIKILNKIKLDKLNISAPLKKLHNFWNNQ